MLLYLKFSVVFFTEGSGILRSHYIYLEFCLVFFSQNFNLGHSSNNKTFIIAAVLTVN